LIETPTEPTFEQAYDHPNHENQNKFRDVTSKEFQGIKEKKVYEEISLSEFPNGRVKV
jgi:hypothetical protein